MLHSLYVRSILQGIPFHWDSKRSNLQGLYINNGITFSDMMGGR